MFLDSSTNRCKAASDKSPFLPSPTSGGSIGRRNTFKAPHRLPLSQSSDSSIPGSLVWEQA